MARCAELAQFASGLDAFEQVFKQVPFGVGIVLVQAQVIYLSNDLRQHHRLVNHQPRTVHEVDGAAACHFGIERKHLVPQKARQVLTRQRPCPGRPAKALARHGAAATHDRRVERVAQRPVAAVNTGHGLLLQAGAGLCLRVQAVGQVEEKKK